MSSDDDEHMLELRANRLGSERQSARLLKYDCNNVVANVTLPQQLLTQIIILVISNKTFLFRDIHWHILTTSVFNSYFMCSPKDTTEPHMKLTCNRQNINIFCSRVGKILPKTNQKL